MSSSRVNIKICGLTRYEDAALAADLGAWGLGFIFTDKSPRNCSPEVAEEICQRLGPRSVEKVGVFLNETPENVNKIARQVGLTYAQLHGTETPKYCAKINVKVLKAIQQLNLADLSLLDDYADCLFLLDAPRAGNNWGGTGHTSDWRLAKKIAQRYPLLLAGNLGADNIVCALDEVKPIGADLSSSVEESPGIKNHQKLKKLFRVLTDAQYVS